MKKFELSKIKTSDDFRTSVESSAKKVRHRKKQLYNSILKQMEFYFGDANLSKDRFLGELMRKDPYVPLSTFLQFNKLRALTDNVDDIAKALVKSEMLKLSDDESKVCRTTVVTPRSDIDDCTVYVECLPPNTDHERLKLIFAQFGNVSYVSIPKFKQNKQIKGFAFIEFEEPPSAVKCIESFTEFGSILQTGMNPEELCSITTFDDPEKSVVKNTLKIKSKMEIQQDNEKVKGDSKTSKEKKRRLSKSDQGMEEAKVKKTKRKLNMCGNEESDLTDSDSLTAKRPRRESQKVVQFNTDNTETSEIETEDNENEDYCKKKRKRKKHVKKNKEEIFSIGLKVLSKKEWKKLRNTYLDLQRTKMQQIKKQLNINREYYNPGHYQQNFYGGQEEDKYISENNAQLEKIPVMPLEFTSNVIVGVKLLEPCVDIKGFKNTVKASAQELKYIDITEGSMEAFLRFSNAGAAASFLKSLNKTNAQNIICPTDINDITQQSITSYLLTGAQEKEYWNKMAKDRDDKRSKKIKIEKKGRDKLIAKAAKNSHVHFNDDE